MTKLPLSHFSGWLANGERGVSSEAIVSQLTGIQIGRHGNFPDHPYDPGDLRRCVKLLDTYPLIGLVFKDEMPKRSPIWAELVANWEHLTVLLKEEIRERTGNAPRTYAEMKRIINGAEK